MKDVAQRLRRIIATSTLCLAFALLPAASSIATPTRDPAPLSQDVRQEMFEKVWTEIRDLYYDPAFHGVNWNQIREKYLPEVHNAKDNDDFYSTLRRMTAELHDAHTRFYSPEQWKRIKQHEHVGLGFTAAEIEGQPVITFVQTFSPAQTAGLKVGMIVQSIGGEPIAQRLAEAAAKHEPSSSARADQLSIYRDAFAAPLGSQVKLSVARPDGSSYETSVPARVYQNFPMVQFKHLDSGVEYIAVDEFTRGNAKSIKDGLRSLRDAPGIILDLRSNGGGELESAVTIAGYFLNDKTLIAKYSTRTGKPIEWFGGLLKLKLEVEAGQSGGALYSGPVTLLVGARTASASEIFSGGMQEIGRMKVVGTQTCGCVLGITKPRELRGGAVLEISESLWMTPKGRKLEGDGIAPDKIIMPTIADLQQKRDTTLAEAEKSLQQSKSAAIPGRP